MGKPSLYKRIFAAVFKAAVPLLALLFFPFVAAHGHGSENWYQFGFWLLLGLLGSCLVLLCLGWRWHSANNKASLGGQQSSNELRECLIAMAKMSNLGHMVAGISHEVKTPLGVGVTAASNLQQKSEQIQALYQSGQLTQESLEQYLKVSAESTGILLSNLQRASALMDSFKRTSVNHVKDQKADVVLAECLGDLFQSLSPALQAHSAELDFKCPPELMIRSYPAAIAQVFTNLLMNALEHGLKPKGGGTIRVRVKAEREGAEIEFADDGVGIAAEHQSRIYEPFFTTNAEAGGTGLGLNIVADLVAKTLCGNIQCTSFAPRGAVFKIYLPSLPPGP
ncbi:MAG: HAMP domain-containing histidine kinase [Cellvibrionaceae bacterium]|nr:HAMP domain-containing histidine kinase [Cellvibrionaceae bacterium]MCV6627608.1 HAMP domain-containing histidine kinase [Cellvibrionaceae bacterium]